MGACAEPVVLTEDEIDVTLARRGEKTPLGVLCIFVAFDEIARVPFNSMLTLSHQAQSDQMF